MALRIQAVQEQDLVDNYRKQLNVELTVMQMRARRIWSRYKEAMDPKERKLLIKAVDYINMLANSIAEDEEE